MTTKEIKKDVKGLVKDLEDIEVEDPIELALHGKKFTKISLEDIERVSVHEQSKYTSDSS